MADKSTSTKTQETQSKIRKLKEQIAEIKVQESKYMEMGGLLGDFTFHMLPFNFPGLPIKAAEGSHIVCRVKYTKRRPLEIVAK